MTPRRSVVLLLPWLHSCAAAPVSAEGWSLLSYCDDVSAPVGSTSQCQVRIQNHSSQSRTFRLHPIEQPATCGSAPFVPTTDRVTLPAAGSMYVFITFSPTRYPEDGVCEGRLAVEAEDDDSAYQATIVLNGRVLDRDDDCDGISVGTGDCFDGSDPTWCA